MISFDAVTDTPTPGRCFWMQAGRLPRPPSHPPWTEPSNGIILNRAYTGPPSSDWCRKAHSSIVVCPHHQENKLKFPSYFDRRHHPARVRDDGGIRCEYPGGDSPDCPHAGRATLDNNGVPRRDRDQIGRVLTRVHQMKSQHRRRIPCSSYEENEAAAESPSPEEKRTDDKDGNRLKTKP